MDIHCLVHPNLGLAVVQNVEPTYSIAQIRSRLFYRLERTFRSRNLTEFDLIAYRSVNLRKDEAERKFHYVETNYKFAEWQIPGGIGASFQSIVGRDGLNSDLVPLVFVVRNVVPSEVAPLAHPPDSNESSLLDVTFLVVLDSNGSPQWGDVMGRNGYKRISVPEEFISDLVTIPRRPAAPDMCNFLRIAINQHIEIPSYRTQISSMINNDTNVATEYSERDHEPTHFSQAIATVRLLDAPMDQFVPETVWLLVLEKFKLFWTTEVQGVCASDNALPFPLIARSVGDNFYGNRYTYHPRSDFVLLKDKFPSFLAEVDSNVNRDDLDRLRVQLACSLRLGLALRGEDSSEKGRFFLMGAFFARQWEIIRLFCYADGQGNVCFIDKLYVVTDVLALTTFLFEFYNYARHVQNGCRVGEKNNAVKSIKEVIDEKGMATLQSTKNDRNMGTRGSKRRKTDENGGQGQNNDQSKEREQITDALRKANFKVKFVNHGPNFATIPESPSHVVSATNSEGEQVIAKLVRRKCSDELSLLRQLNTQRSSLNHVIPLIGTLESAAGLLVILPKKTPILSLSRDILSRECTRLSQQLLEGVAFLHKNKIAHLDIKPGNLVWDSTSRHLLIIDFDIAVRCEDVDQMVEMSCGTPGWSAPEIVHDDKTPLHPFNPIRADLWSCGAVLKFFGGKKDRTMDFLTGLLLDHDPRRRPLLHELVDEGPDFWKSGRLPKALEAIGSLKRSCSDSDPTGPKNKRTHVDDSSTVLDSVSNLNALQGVFR